MSRRTIKAGVLLRMRLYLAELGDPIYSASKEGAEARSYAVSTVEELIKRVENSDDPPEMVVSEFIKRVNRRSGMVFRVAYEISGDLYDRVFL